MKQNGTTINTVLVKELPLFKHSCKGIVKFAEVDLSGVVHNIQYLYWAEWARTQYFLNLGLDLTYELFMSEFNHRIVHSEIDYYEAAGLCDEYEALTRITWIKNSSLGIDNIIVSKGKILAKISAVLVFINPQSLQPRRISEKLRNLLAEFEGGNINFIEFS